MANRYTVAGWAVLVLAVATWPLIDRLLDRPFTLLGRERIKYLRGAQGEALVGWLLQQLDEEWHVFHGMQLQDGQDIDHVVVGPGGLFCVSTKNFRGLFSHDAEGRVLYNN